MESVILVIHLILALAIIGLVLLQRSEGGGLGIGGGGGGIGGLATAKGAASALTRATGICAALFFVTSLTLGVMAGHRSTQTGLIEAVGAAAAPAAIEETVDGKAPAEVEESTNEVPEAPVNTE
jgi:preprotein translocase subunit SecG